MDIVGARTKDEEEHILYSMIKNDNLNITEVSLGFSLDHEVPCRKLNETNRWANWRCTEMQRQGPPLDDI